MQDYNCKFLNKLEKGNCDVFKSTLYPKLVPLIPKNPKKPVTIWETASHYFQNLDRSLLYHVIANDLGDACFSSIVNVQYDDRIPSKIQCNSKILKSYSHLCISQPRYKIVYLFMSWTTSCLHHTAIILVDHKLKQIELYEVMGLESIEEHCISTILALFPKLVDYKVSPVWEKCLLRFSKWGETTGGTCWLWSLLVFAIRIQCGEYTFDQAFDISQRFHDTASIQQLLSNFICYLHDLVERKKLAECVQLWKSYNQYYKQLFNTFSLQTQTELVKERTEIQSEYFRGDLKGMISKITPSIIYSATLPLQILIKQLNSTLQDEIKESELNIVKSACCGLFQFNIPKISTQTAALMRDIISTRYEDLLTSPKLTMMTMMNTFQSLIDQFGGATLQTAGQQATRKMELCQGLNILHIIQDVIERDRINKYELNFDLIPNCARYWPTDYNSTDTISFIENPDAMNLLNRAFIDIVGQGKCRQSEETWTDNEGNLHVDSDPLFICCDSDAKMKSYSGNILSVFHNMLTEVYVFRLIRALHNILKENYNKTQLWSRVLDDMFIVNGCVNAPIERLEKVAKGPVDSSEFARNVQKAQKEAKLQKKKHAVFEYKYLLVYILFWRTPFLKAIRHFLHTRHIDGRS